MHDSRAALAEMQAAMRALQAQLDQEHAAARKEREVALQRIAQLEHERENLRASHERLRLELELWKRKLFIAKAERADDEKQLRLEYEHKLRELDTLAGTLGLAKHEEPPAGQELARDGKRRGKRAGNRGTGRRKLQELPLEEERIEIADPHLEQLVAEGKVVRHGFEDSFKLAHKGATKALRAHEHASPQQLSNRRTSSLAPRPAAPGPALASDLATTKPAGATMASHSASASSLSMRPLR